MHEGHRDRMRERILLSGIESLQPHEVLEYLLYHAIPRKDTNGIAHELISKFGSFNGVLNADYDALLDVNGMTANAALLLTSLKGVFRMYASGDVSPSVQDVELTRAIAAALQLIKIKLADHYIFSDFGYCSFVEDGVGGQIQQNVNNFLKDGIKY